MSGRDRKWSEDLCGYFTSFQSRTAVKITCPTISSPCSATNEWIGSAVGSSSISATSEEMISPSSPKASRWTERIWSRSSGRGRTKGRFTWIHVHRVGQWISSSPGSSSSHCTISEVSEMMRVQRRRQIRLTSVRNVAEFFLGRRNKLAVQTHLDMHWFKEMRVFVNHSERRASITSDATSHILILN